MRSVPLPDNLKAGTYQLTADTVSPTRVVGRDADGIEVEETLSCYPLREMFCDRAGNLCDVVLCNSRTRAVNNEAKIYALQVRQDWLRDGGLPISECPHATSVEYRHLLPASDGSLIPAPKGVTACGGKPDGCPHFHAIREKRLEAQKKKTQKAESQNATLNSTQLEAMGAAFGAQFATAMAAGDAKAHLRQRAATPGGGEKDD